MAKLPIPGAIIEQLDALWFQLLRGATPEQRTLSFNLYLAAQAVAVHGCDQVSKELTKRVTTWRARRTKASTDEANRARTAHAVKHSSKVKSRASVAESAYEDVARTEGISPSTAEKRRYRKPRR
jgi:hypothetical protein